jgi:hypothetical protein
MISTWIQDAIKHWESDKTELSSGADLDSIIFLEKEVRIKLPADFAEFYRSVNGFESLCVNSNLFYLWSIEKILANYKNSEKKNFIGFCDYMIASHTIGFFKNLEGVYNEFDLEIPITTSFKEFIKFINSPLTDSSFVLPNK